MSFTKGRMKKKETNSALITMAIAVILVLAIPFSFAWLDHIIPAHSADAAWWVWVANAENVIVHFAAEITVMALLSALVVYLLEDKP